MYMFICMSYIYICICIYVYIYNKYIDKHTHRERERERERDINARQNEVFLAISRAHRGGTGALASVCAAGLALWRIASLELPHGRPPLEAGRSKDRTLHSSAEFRIWDLARSVERISVWNLRAQRRVCCGTIPLQDGASTTAVRTPGA
jgi:hypothetical protein